MRDAMREPRDPSNMHFKISMIKSVLRMIGYMVLPFSIILGILWLIVAETLGILEEL